MSKVRSQLCSNYNKTFRFLLGSFCRGLDFILRRCLAVFDGFSTYLINSEYGISPQRIE